MVDSVQGPIAAFAPVPIPPIATHGAGKPTQYRHVPFTAPEKITRKAHCLNESCIMCFFLLSCPLPVLGGQCHSQRPPASDHPQPSRAASFAGLTGQVFPIPVAAARMTTGQPSYTQFQGLSVLVSFPSYRDVSAGSLKLHPAASFVGIFGMLQSRLKHSIRLSSPPSARFHPVTARAVG